MKWAIVVLHKLETDQTMVKQATQLCNLETNTTFLFKEGDWTSNLRSNYKMGSEPAGTFAIEIIDKAGVLAVTLNKSNLDLKQMIGLLVRPT